MPSVHAGIIVFFTSAAVLVLEILAARLLAPYVGVTLQTYTGIIAVVLAGISVGTWYGGRLADRHDPRRLLGPTVVLGGVLALFVIPLVTFLGTGLRGGGVAAILILTSAAFFLPAAVLSAVTPTVIKIQLQSLDETGSVVGRLSALGTAGAIFGTLVTGFVLVAAAPSRPVVLVLGTALIVGGITLWWWLAPAGERAPVWMLGIGVLAGALTALASGPCDVESAYYCAVVEADEERDSGRILELDMLRHSYVDLDDPTHLEFGYTKVFGDVLAVAAPPGEPIETLHVGGGGFAMPRYISTTRPGSHSQVLEIDPTLVRIAEQRLGLEPDDALDIDIGDARLALAEQPDEHYDVVIGDAFAGLAVPWHLTTAEFATDVKRTMRPGAMYTINVIDHPPLAFARAKVATMRAVFDHVAVVTTPPRLAGAEGGNVVVVASDAPLDVDGLRAAIDERDGEHEIATGAAVDDFVDGAQVLTDDYAPVDQLLTPPY